MNKLNLKELGQMDVKDIGKLIKNLNFKDIEINEVKKVKKRSLRRGKDVLSIDVGTNSIKLVEGKYEKEKLNIKTLVKVKTPQDAILDGQIIMEEEILRTIKEALEINKIKAKNITVTTNSSSIINREILIPKVAEDELETVIKYEIQQYLPINLDDYIIQYLILEEVKIEDKKKFKVNVTSYPEKMAYSYYKLIESLELNPYTLDVNYNSIGKLANYGGFNNKNKDGSVAFVDIGSTSINISIFKDCNLAFTRMIKIGGDTIDNLISQDLNMSIKSTESKKIKETDLLGDESSLNIIVRKAVDEILEEIERVLNFYNNKFSTKIETIYLYGGTAKFKNIKEYIKLKLQVELDFGDLNELRNILMNSDLEEDSDFEEYLNALGALIRV